MDDNEHLVSEAKFQHHGQRHNETERFNNLFLDYGVMPSFLAFVLPHTQIQKINKFNTSP